MFQAFTGAELWKHENHKRADTSSRQTLQINPTRKASFVFEWYPMSKFHFHAEGYAGKYLFIFTREFVL